MGEKKTDEKRYDRQLRLWGEEGQSLLESAHICVLNANATATETLKNLVLPGNAYILVFTKGIGSFTIIDGRKVTPSDLNNFFIEESSIGASRAATTQKLISELNDLVTGHFIERDPAEVIKNDLDSFKQYSLVIASDLPQESLLPLSSFLWSQNIPLVVVRACGLIGYLRLAVPEHTVVQSKPDNPPDDLRLANPFPELEKWANSLDFESMDSTTHSHTPYLAIILQYLQKWKETHEGKLPSNYKEKNEFRNLVIKGSRNPHEENFDEAYKSALKTCTPTTIPSDVRAVLDDPKAASLTASSSKFWILAHAVKGFVENEGGGFLPLSGSISDMTASTQGYITVQTLYQQKALADAQAVAERVKKALEGLGKPTDFISWEEIKQFCKNANFLFLIRYRSLEDELANPSARLSAINSELAADSQSIMHWYVSLRIAEVFYSLHRRYPGEGDGAMTEDVPILKKLGEEFVAQHKIENFNADFLAELVRFGNSELHPIAAFMGGVASQEVIKLITHQYVPMNNTFLFSGLNSTTLTSIV